ncbi:MAG: hypothetical protein AAFS06_22360, partial [Cyanobacteria bacterium J06631_12]
MRRMLGAASVSTLAATLLLSQGWPGKSVAIAQGTPAPTGELIAQTPVAQTPVAQTPADTTEEAETAEDDEKLVYSELLRKI